MLQLQMCAMGAVRSLPVLIHPLYRIQSINPRCLLSMYGNINTEVAVIDDTLWEPYRCA